VPREVEPVFQVLQRRPVRLVGRVLHGQDIERTQPLAGRHRASKPGAQRGRRPHAGDLRVSTLDARVGLLQVRRGRGRIARLAVGEEVVSALERMVYPHARPASPHRAHRAHYTRDARGSPLPNAGRPDLDTIAERADASALPGVTYVRSRVNGEAAMSRR